MTKLPLQGPIVVELAARYIVVRVKGRRDPLTVQYDVLLDSRKREFQRTGGKL
jgi:hypothetical protein